MRFYTKLGYNLYWSMELETEALYDNYMVKEMRLNEELQQLEYSTMIVSSDELKCLLKYWLKTYKGYNKVSPIEEVLLKDVNLSIEKKEKRLNDDFNVETQK